MTRFASVGNAWKYEHSPQAVELGGTICHPDLALKLYVMLEPAVRKTFDWETVLCAKNFLAAEIDNGMISPLIGLGFAILSKDMLNVARWDKTHPIVLKNQLYEYQQGSLTETIRLLDIRDVGPFCVWELGIVGHERNVWIKYLSSKRTEEDKSAYLSVVMDGSLDLP